MFAVHLLTYRQNLELMKTFLSLATLLALNISFSQCTSTTTTKILILGDSWAYFSWDFDSYDENFNNYGLTDYNSYSTANLAVNGAVASTYFDDANRVQEIETYINSNPDLEYVHLSLGGNDVMDVWNNTMSQAETDAILDTLMVDLKNGIDIIHGINPDLKIIISGYDYANFGEIIGSLAPAFQPFHPYYNLWDSMGKPDFTEINTLLATASDRFEDSTWVWPNTVFINNLGLMQWHFGQETPLQVAPYGTYPVNSAPVPGGIVDYPSPQIAMNFGGQDAFHLNDEGYEVFIGRFFKEYYWWQIRKPHQTLFASDMNKNGSITAGTSSNNFVTVGSDQGEKSLGIIHFNTSIMDDTYPLQSASIFIMRDSSAGTTYAGQEIQLEIKSGFFGTSEFLELADFADPADDSAAACTFGTIDTNGTYLRIDIPSAFLPLIDPNGTTQFRLSYDQNDSTRFVNFLNDSDEILLDLKYSTNPFAKIDEHEHSELAIYPNPANNLIQIKGIAAGERIKVYDLNGQLKLDLLYQNGGIDISSLAIGMYVVQFGNEGNQTALKLIVQ